jgi:hypothetical protein
VPARCQCWLLLHELGPLLLLLLVMLWLMAQLLMRVLQQR